MRKLSTAVATAILALLFVSPVHSAMKKTLYSQWAIVTQEGAAVYKAASFDAPIIDYLSQGKKIRVSLKIYKGIGGFGAFYKVQLNKNIYGYIADVDVTPEFKPSGKPGAKVERPYKNPEFDPEASSRTKMEPIPLTRYVGIDYALVNYSEIVDGKTLSANTSMYGLKLSGAGALLTDVPLELSFLFSVSPPSYYEDKIELASPPSGFFILTDLILQMPFIDWRDGMFYYGLGPMATYTKFKINPQGDALDSQELRVGATFMGGYAQRFSRDYLFKLGVKYYVERKSYTSLGVALQMRY